jgi:hypothetical protein
LTTAQLFSYPDKGDISLGINQFEAIAQAYRPLPIPLLLVSIPRIPNWLPSPLSHFGRKVELTKKLLEKRGYIVTKNSAVGSSHILRADVMEDKNRIVVYAKELLFDTIIR